MEARKQARGRLTGLISPPDRDSTSALLRLVYDVSVDSDPRDPRLVEEGTGRDHFLETLSLKDPVRSRPLPPSRLVLQSGSSDGSSSGTTVKRSSCMPNLLVRGRAACNARHESSFEQMKPSNRFHTGKTAAKLETHPLTHSTGVST